MLVQQFFVNGLAHSSYPIGYPINPDCPWHADSPPIEAVARTTYGPGGRCPTVPR